MLFGIQGGKGTDSRQLKRLFRDSLVAQLVKKLPAMQETCVRSLGWEDPPEKGKATRSSILAWRIPWGRKESDMTEGLSLLLSSTFIL